MLNNMDLQLDIKLASGYKNKSQIARVLTEAWFDDNAYCPACSSNDLERLPDNAKVIDFKCPKCDEQFQLKSKSSKFGNVVSNSGYDVKIKKIKAGLAPNYAFLRYNNKEYEVENLMIIPKHFMTIEAIQKRNPLKPTAERHGWVGSNILLNRFPPDARLHLILDGHEIPKRTVRTSWKRFEFMKEKRYDTKGWLNDVLICVRELDKTQFTLQEMYDFVPKLEQLYPDNKHVPDKIRQQLQILRDNGIIEFKERGVYRIR